MKNKIDLVRLHMDEADKVQYGISISEEQGVDF